MSWFNSGATTHGTGFDLVPAVAPAGRPDVRLHPADPDRSDPPRLGSSRRMVGSGIVIIMRAFLAVPVQVVGNGHQRRLPSLLRPMEAEGELFVNDPPAANVGFGSALPAGAELTPFTARASCG